MAEVSGIFPNMIGAVESTSPKTATEINTKSQGQMTRLAMIVDIINQDLIIPNVEKVAKLCADFKTGTETIYVDHDNKQEYIEIDDYVRQGDYKYTYSDTSVTAEKSQQADLVVSAVEKFAQLIPLNVQEIFTWYFEQKGVDNPERFLGAGVNAGVNENQPDLGLQAGSAGVNEKTSEEGQQVGSQSGEENTSAQVSDTSQSAEGSQFDINKLITLLTMLKQSKGQKTDDTAPDFMSIIGKMLEEMEEN